MNTAVHPIAEQFNDFISQQPFPCVIAKDSVKKGNARILVAGHMACPADDRSILDFIYTFDGHCAPGKHVLRVTAEDVAGNRTTKEYRFTR